MIANKTSLFSLVSCLFLVALLVQDSQCLNCRGCTPLDNVTFDKMIQTFRASLVKFDVAYPYGDKHDEFAKVAVDAGQVKELFVGEVGIKDYGEKDNEDLGKRFKITKDDFPAVMLFVAAEDGKMSEHRFSGDDFTSSSLKAFLRQHTGIYLPLPGCVEALDILADKMVRGAKESWETVLKEAEAEVGNIKDEKVKKRAEIYVKIMTKIIAEGEEFVGKETQRTKKLLEGKVTDLKKKDLQQKLNIMRSFTLPPPPPQDQKKEEL